MEFFEENDATDSSDIDLLGSSSRSRTSSHGPSAQQVQEKESEEEEQQRVIEEQDTKQQTTPSFPRGTAKKLPTPRSASLFDKLDKLERRWTDQATSAKKKRDPTDNLKSGESPFSPFASPSVDSISPITLFGNSPLRASVGEFIADDSSISSYGSLGPPPKPHKLFPSRLQRDDNEDDRKPPSTGNTSSRKVSLFDRLYRGEKRATPLWKPPPVKGPREFVFGTPTKRPPEPPTRKPITSISKARAKPGITTRKAKVLPFPSPPTFSFSKTNQPKSSLSAQTRDIPSTGKKTVYERLYRKERRSMTLWTDPGAKWSKKFRFVSSDGASKTQMISLTDKAMIPGIKRQLFMGSTPSSPENGKLATGIQNAWRFHQAHSQLIGKLVQHWSVDCYPTDNGGVQAFNRILRLKYGILARTTAIQKAGLPALGHSVTIHRHDVRFENFQDVCFEVWENDALVQRKYSVHVQCNARMIEVLRSWNPEKLGCQLYRWALELSCHDENDKLVYAASVLLQQWFFASAHHNRRRLLPTSSSDDTLERQIATYESLSWFHHRLQSEAMPAIQARFDGAAIMIQKHFRRRLAHRYFEALRKVHTLQLRMDDRTAGALLNIAAVIVQKAWRESRTRLRETAARFIQLHFLSYLHWKVNPRERLAVLVEAEYSSLAQRKRFCMVVDSVLKIQALYRGHLVRRRVGSSAATIVLAAWFTGPAREKSLHVVQSFIRMLLARNVYRQQMRSIVLVQAFQRQRNHRSRFCRTVNGFVLLQACWRAFCARQKINASSATALEMAWNQRGRLVEESSAVKIQRWQRMQVARTTFLRRLSGVIRLQAVARSWHLRRCSYRLAFAAGKLSLRSRLRGGLRENRYFSAVRVIEAFVGATQGRIRNRQVGSAAVLIQSMIRMGLHRAAYKTLIRRREVDKVATKLQSWFLMVKCSEAFDRIRQSALILQHRVRRRQVHRRELDKVATQLQSWFRMIKCSEAFFQIRQSVVLLQCLVRRIQAQFHLQCYIKAVRTLQCRIRALGTRSKYIRIRRAALLMQRRWRETLRRQIATVTGKPKKINGSDHQGPLGSRPGKGEMSAVVIQSFCRGLQPHQAYIALRHAALTLQKFGRGYVARRKMDAIARAAQRLIEFWRRHFLESRLLRQHTAAISLQNAWKSAHKRKQSKAALVIQAAYRAFHPHQAFRAVQHAALALQRFGRGYVARVKMDAKRRAAQRLIEFWRKQSMNRALLQQHNTARSLQDAWQAAGKRKRSKAVIVIQAAYRGFHPHQAFIALQHAALTLQRFRRGYVAGMEMDAMTRAAQRLIEFWRSYSMKRGLLQQQEAARSLQYAWQAPGKRKRIKAVIVIQAAYRGFHPHQAFIALQRAALTLQRYVRGYVVRVTMDATKTAQRHDRASRTILSWLLTLGSDRRRLRYRAARRIQAVWRRFARRGAFQIHRRAILTLQVAWRRQRLHECEHEKIRRQAADCIVLQFRAHKDRKRTSMSARALQLWWRACLQRKLYRKICRAVLLVQSLTRRRAVSKCLSLWHRAARKIQVVFRKTKHSLPRFTEKKSALIVQRQVRAWICRKNVSTLTLCCKFLPPHTRKKFLHNNLGSRVWGSRIRMLLRDRVNMALVVQRWWRQSIQRSRFFIQKQSAIRVQRWLRCYVLPLLQTQGLAATRLSAWWRAKEAEQNFRRLVLCSALLLPTTLENMTSRVQGSEWGSKIRRQLKFRAEAASLLSKWWRSQKTQSTYKQQKRCAIIVQTVIRAKLAKREFACLKMSRSINRNRQLLEALLVHHTRQEFQKAILVVQKYGRRAVCIRRYQQKKVATVAIQGLLRHGFLASVQRRMSSAGTIQKWWKKRLQKRNALRLLLCRSYLSKTTLKTMSLRIEGADWGAQVRRRMKHRAEAALIVQTKWRSHHCKTVFIQKRMAAVLIQARFRSWSLHQQHLQHLDAALQIQSAWRAHQGQALLFRMRHSIVTIQRVARGCLERKHYHVQDSIVKLVYAQATIRGWLARQGLKHQGNAATSISSLWRSHYCKTAFTQMRSATVLIQTRFRGWSLYYQHLQHLDATLQIQSAWKAHQGQALLFRIRHSIVTIQRVARGCLARKHYHVQDSIVKLVYTQAAIRGWLARQGLKHQGNAATSISSLWRSHYCKTAFTQMRSAAVLIQTRFRGWSLYYQHLQQLDAALQIQSAWRAHQGQALIFRMRQSVVTIQRVARGCLARKHNHVQDSIVKLVYAQAAIRGWLSRQGLKHQGNAATSISSHWRSYHCKTAFTQKSSAAVLIQTRFRGWSLCHQHLQHLDAALQIQSAWRAHQGQALLFRMRHSILTIQRVARGCLARKHYHVLKHSIAKLECAQAAVRGWLIRQKLKQHASAATVISCNWRSLHCLSSFSQKRHAAVLIQARFRSLRSQHASKRGSSLQEQFLELENGAHQIQSSWKTHQETVALTRTKEAAVAIQCRIRTYLARKHCRVQKQAILKLVSAQAAIRRWLVRKEMKQQVSACTLVQSYWRAHVAHKWFQEAQKASVVLQCFAISIMLRQERARHERQQLMAIKLQNLWRTHQCQVVFARTTEAAVAVQCIARRYLARKHCHVQKQSILKLVPAQAAIRGWLVREELKQQVGACTLVQSYWRAHVAHKWFQEAQQASVVLQCFAISIMLRQERERHKREQQMASAVTVISCNWRSFHCASSFSQKRHAAVLIQARFRSWCSHQASTRGSSLQEHFLEYESNAHQIQSSWKTHKEQVAFTRTTEAAAAVQCFIRAYLGRKHYHVLQQSILKLVSAQAAIRGSLVRQELKQQASAATVISCNWRSCACKTAFTQKRSAAVLIQAKFRSWSLYNWHLDHLDAAAVKIQSEWRAHQSQAIFGKTKKLVVTIQRFVRTFLARAQYHVIQQSIAKLVSAQASIRGWLVRLELKQQSNAATIVSCKWRSHYYRSVFTAKRTAAILIQTRFRSWCSYQASRRGPALQQQLLQYRNGAQQIQASWKAHQELVALARKRQSVATLHSFAKRHLARLQQRRRHQSILKLVHAQAAVRGWLLREGLKHQAIAVSIMSSRWRSCHCRCVFSEKRNAAVLIQSTFRGSTRYMIMVQRNIQIRNQAAIVIQEGFVKWKTKISFLAVQSSLVLLKRSCNGLLGRSAASFAIQHINRELQSSIVSSRILVSINDVWQHALVAFEYYVAVVLQRAMENLLVRRRALDYWKVHQTIPDWIADDQFASCLRMFQVMQWLEFQNIAATRIQRWYKNKGRVVPTPSLRPMNLRFSVFQRHVRRKLVAKREMRRQSSIAQEAVVMIQAQMRCWHARKAVRAMRLQRAAEQCDEIRAELQAHLLRTVYKSASRKAEVEVTQLLAPDEENIQVANQSVCLRRLAHRVVLGRISAEHQNREVNETMNLLDSERQTLRRLAP